MLQWQWYFGSPWRIADKEWRCSKCDSRDSLLPENTLAAINDLRDFIEDFLQSCSLSDSRSIFWQIITESPVACYKVSLAGFGWAESLKSTQWVTFHTKTSWEPLSTQLCLNRSSGTYGTQSMYKKYSWMSLKKIRGPSSRSCKWAHSYKRP